MIKNFKCVYFEYFDIYRKLKQISNDFFFFDAQQISNDSTWKTIRD